MTTDDTSMNNEMTEVVKTIYVTPSVKEYGSINELVKSGSNPALEGGSDDDYISYGSPVS